MSEFSTNVTEGISYQVVSSLPGRIRLSIPSLFKNSTDQNTLRRLVAAIEGVTSVRINPLASSIIVTFAEGKVSPAQLEQKLATAISQTISPVTPQISRQTELIEAENVLHSRQEPLKTRDNLLEVKAGDSQTLITPEPREATEQKLGDADYQDAQSKIKNPKSKIEIIQNSKWDTTEEFPIKETLSSTVTDQQLEVLPVNYWQQQCQLQAESIEKLEDRLAALKPVAAIASAWLRRWYVNSPKTINSSFSPSSFAPEVLPKKPETEAQWQELAAKQKQAIIQLEQSLVEWQRLAVIGEARLNKYRKYL